MRQLTSLEKQRGEQLAQFLNGALDKYGQIGELLEWCRQLRVLYENRPPLARSPERVAYEQQRATLLTRINRLVLCKYQVIPRLDASEQGLAIGWEAVRALAPEEVQALRAFKSDPQPIGPQSAVQIILEMTVAGSIARIRQCENPGCGKWIMAVSEKKVACDAVCRFAKYAAKQGSRANDMARSRKLHRDNPNLKKQKRITGGRPPKKGNRNGN
ncbi:MAG: hypothetical protein WAN12_02830 [Candidatus Acidiferrum sp.]